MSISIKPDYTKYTDEEIKDMYNQVDNCNENLTRQEMVDKLLDVWSSGIIEPEIECAICMNSITNGNHLILNCYHYYHTDCYLQYTQTSNNYTCPLCRKAQLESNDISNYNRDLYTQYRPLLDTDIYMDEQYMYDEMFILGANNNIHRIYTSDNDDL